jgi:hypothetical protein
VLARNARSFNDETLDSRGNKGCMKYFEHRHPVCTHDDCGGPMSFKAVMWVTGRGEADHEICEARGVPQRTILSALKRHTENDAA